MAVHQATESKRLLFQMYASNVRILWNAISRNLNVNIFHDSICNISTSSWVGGGRGGRLVIGMSTESRSNEVFNLSNELSKDHL